MVKSVYVRGAGGVVDFPDTATPEQISTYISKVYGAPAAAEVPVEPEAGQFSTGPIGATLHGAATGIAQIPEGLAGLFYPERYLRTTGLGRATKYVTGGIDYLAGRDRTKEQTTGEMLGGALGSLAPTLLGGGVARKAASAIKLAADADRIAAIAGTLAGVGMESAGRMEQIREQRRSGMDISEGQSLAAQQASGALGALEVLPLKKYFGPLTKIFSKIPASKAATLEKILQNRLGRVIRTGTEEGIQEAVQGVLNDVAEQQIYNPDVQVGQDLLSNAAGGAFAGSVLEGVIQLAAGRKLRGYRQLQKDLAAESSQNLSDLNQASVAQAAEGLRATGVEGPLNIEPNEDPDGAIRYTITTPAGKPLVDTYSEAEANAAVDLYRQTTGAKVSVNTTQAPKLAGVRIGNTRFPSIEAADKARQSVRQQVRDLDSYFNNIELVSRHAAEKGVAPGIYAKQIDETLRSARNKLAQFDAYFEAPGVEPVKPGPTITPPAPTEKAAEAAVAPVAPVAAPIAPVAPVASAEASVAPEIPAEAPSGIAAIETPEPITEEEQVPEMPIGAIELPVEESRILPDTIVDEEVAPEILDQPAPTQIVQRPSATDEQLTALKTELFGKPIGYSEMSSEQQSLYDAERDRRYPPQDTEVYLSAGPTGTKAPRTLREAEITNPIERDYTPERKEWMKKLYAGVQARIEAIAPGAAKAEFKTLIESDPGYLIRGQERGIETQYGIKSIIDLSIGILKPGMSVEDAVNQLVDIVNHEIIHVLTRKGVLRPEEWRMLSRAVANTNVPGKKYTYLDKAEAVYTPNGIPISKEYANPEAVVEEAVAEMYRDWVKNKKAPQPVVGLFNRITEFFRRIFRALRDANYDKVFQQIEAGEVGKRTGEAATTGARMSAGPVMDMAGYQDENGVHIRPSEAQDSYIAFDPEQVKSTFNKFEEGAATSPRFSAAPLPPYMAQQNETLFAKEEKVPILDKMARHFSGQRPLGKTLRTLHYGDIEIGKWEMAGLSGRAAAVDSAAYMKHIESLLNQKQTGNYQRMGADTSATAALMWRRRSGHLTASMMLRGKLALSFQTPGDIMSATMKVENDPDNLKEIFKVMNEEGPLNPSTGERDTKGVIFRSYAVAKRAEWLRSTGQSVPRELTPQYVREAIDLATREYPEVVEAYNKYQRFNKNLLTTARDAGLISDAELGRLTNQMNYYGFIYEVYGEPLGPTSSQKTGSKFKLRPYTGSGRGGLVNDPMFVMIQNAQFWVDSIAKNLASYKSFEVARQMGEARLLQTGEAPDELAGEAPDVMFFSKDGVVKRFAVKDPLLVTALGSDDRITVGKFWDTIGVPAHILRESVTRDPGFMARNLLRDTVSSWITSGVDFMPVIDTLKGFSTALKTGTSFEELSARGVVGSYDLAMMGPGEIADVFKRNAMPLNVKTVTSVGGLNAVARSLWNRMGHVSEASDAATRIAVYDALRKQGMSEAEAATQAIELLDFTRRGASQTLGILTKLIPFLNARIQGMDVLYQAGRSGIRYATGRSRGEQDANVGKKFLVRGAMLASIAIALEMMNQGDDDYEQLDDYVKNGNLLVPLKHFGLKGQFLAIPKPFEAGLIFATFPQQIYKTVTGEASGRENAELFFSQLSSTFGVNPIPQALLPGVEILTNHSFYTGLPLVSEGKSRLAPELQYNTNTSQLAMMIGGLPIFYDFTTGKFGGMSPIVVDKLISGYAGPMGTYMVEGVSLLMEDSNVGPDRMPREISNLPVVKSFFVDVKKKNPKVVTQAYELFRIADEANRTMSRLKQMRDVEALTEYVSENKDILRYKKYIFKLADNLNKLSAQERSIERDSTMTRDEKLAAQYKLRETRIRLASKVDEINKVLGR